jgi:SAM-dependent methyltransferase
MRILKFTRKIAKRLAIPLARYSAAGQASGDNHLLNDFLAHAAKLPAPRVLELGTRRLYENVKTKHDEWVPHAAQFLGTDIAEGTDVDIIADVHKLSDAVGCEQFDIIISCSSFEHFKYPQLAAHEIMKVLKVGGLLFIQTHQAYPVHGAPYDYFRFSREALAGLFGTKMGFRVIETDYEFPASINSPDVASIAAEPAFVNSRLLGEKTGKTPAEYIYEYDV